MNYLLGKKVALLCKQGSLVLNYSKMKITEFLIPPTFTWKLNNHTNLYKSLLLIIWGSISQQIHFGQTNYRDPNLKTSANAKGIIRFSRDKGEHFHTFCKPRFLQLLHDTELGWVGGADCNNLLILVTILNTFSWAQLLFPAPVSASILRL